MYSRPSSFIGLPNDETHCRERALSEHSIWSRMLRAGSIQVHRTVVQRRSCISLVPRTHSEREPQRLQAVLTSNVCVDALAVVGRRAETKCRAASQSSLNRRHRSQIESHIAFARRSGAEIRHCHRVSDIAALDERGRRGSGSHAQIAGIALRTDAAIRFRPRSGSVCPRVLEGG